ncbi:hypothetical protein [Aeromicrobium sp. UC242_57]|uniref:hypothetical protein n=1 Tax=Aeromicrobium sp. UC242_57 TaxID=3374624 RepID=UPI0037ADA07B
MRLLTAGGAVVGDAQPGSFARDVPPSPTLQQAEQGLADYPGFHQHPFDRCFTCGVARDEGDGLRIFTGRSTTAEPQLFGARTPPSAEQMDSSTNPRRGRPSTVPAAGRLISLPSPWCSDA